MMALPQELMTPHEAARWFRRSPSWLRQQTDLLRVAGAAGQPLYHVQACRAFVLARMCELDPPETRRAQVAALAAACGLSVNEPVLGGLLAAAGATCFQQTDATNEASAG